MTLKGDSAWEPYIYGTVDTQQGRVEITSISDLVQIGFSEGIGSAVIPAYTAKTKWLF